MEKSIDDVEFRKLVLKMHDDGHSREEIIEKLDIKKSLFEDIIFTFKYLDTDKKLKNGKYTDKELEFIKNNIDKKIPFFIVNLERRYNSIQSKVYLIKNETKKRTVEQKEDELKNGYKYTKEEEMFIKESINNGDSIKDVAVALGRSENAISIFCHKKKIKCTNKHRFKEEEVNIIKELVDNGFTYMEIAVRINRHPNSIRNYCNKHKIKRSIDTIPNGYKQCYRCGEIKPISEFYKLKKSKDGLYSSCKKCINEANKKNKERRKNGK